MPDWAGYVKTAYYKELGPLDNDWLYTRAASIAYQIYMKKKVGVNTLRKHYGTNARRGTKTEHHALAAGKNIRYALMQLEAAKIVGTARYESDDGVSIIMGKCLTTKGITDMDRIASQIVKENKRRA